MDPYKAPLNYREALSKATEMCSRSEKCCLDIEMKCREWQLTDEETARMLDYLKQEKFIDSQRYANSFVHDKFRFNKWGKVKLAYSLRMKQVEERFIRLALAGLPEQAYQTVLLDLLSAKAKSIREKDSYTRRGKLLAFAQGRGFEAELALKMIERIK